MGDISVQLTTAWSYVLPILTAVWAAVVASIGYPGLPWVVAAFIAGKAINGSWGNQTGQHYAKAGLYALIGFVVAAVAASLWAGRV